MMFDAFVLASLMGISLLALFSKFPQRVRDFFTKHVLLTDAALLFATLGTFGLTATGLMAGVMLDTFMTIALYVANHKGDFLYLYDLKDFVATSLKKLQAEANRIGTEYRHKKAIEAEVTVS